jgi:hypothetical protein
LSHSWDRCYDFKNIFAETFGEQNGFLLKFLQKYDHSIEYLTKIIIFFKNSTHCHFSRLPEVAADEIVPGPGDLPARVQAPRVQLQSQEDGHEHVRKGRRVAHYVTRTVGGQHCQELWFAAT